MHTEIWIKTSFIGWHAWREAPEEVAYLRSTHRHVFNVKVGFYVNHDDRDIEFHIAKKRIDEIIQTELVPIMQAHHGVTFSCEQIAVNLARRYDEKYPPAIMHHEQLLYVEVDEDGECGAIFHKRTVD